MAASIFEPDILKDLCRHLDMKLLGDGLSHAMHLVTAAGAGLLIVGKVIFDALARQVFRQRLAPAFLPRLAFGGWQAGVRKLDDITVLTVGVILGGSLLSFIEKAINVLFATRRKPMQTCQRQLFLEFDDALGELMVLRLQRGNARHQLLNSRFAGSDHQILESEPYRGVNRRSREPSAGNLVLPHRMANHRVNVDAVENPVELLGRELDDRRLAPGPSEPVFRQSLQDHHKTGPIEEQQLHSVAAAIAKRKDRRRERVQLHHLLHQDCKAVDAGAKVDRLAMQVDFQISTQSEHGPGLR